MQMLNPKICGPVACGLQPNFVKLEKQLQKRQCSTKIIYDSHVLSKWMPMGSYPTIPSKNNTTDIWVCWINTIRMEEHRIDPILDNQIVRTNKLGLSWPKRSLCIHVVVDNMIIIKCQSHNYLNLVPLSTVTGIIGKAYVQTPRHLKISCMSAVKRIMVLANNVSFVKGKGCNDRHLLLPPPV